jgi:hypothetical protein
VQAAGGGRNGRSFLSWRRVSEHNGGMEVSRRAVDRQLPLGAEEVRHRRAKSPTCSRGPV